MGFAFGNFYGICDEVALVVCPLLGSDLGLEPSCYSRNVEINSTIIFQPGKQSSSIWVDLKLTRLSLQQRALFIFPLLWWQSLWFITLGQSTLLLVSPYKPFPSYFALVLHTLSSPPGRKEIVLFFYLYGITEILVIFLESAIIPTYSPVYSVSALNEAQTASLYLLTTPLLSGLLPSTSVCVRPSFGVFSLMALSDFNSQKMVHQSHSG